MNTSVPIATPRPPWRGRVPYVGIAVAAIAFIGLAVLIGVAGKPYFAVDLRLSQWVQGLPYPPEFQPFMRGVSLAGDDLLLASLFVGGGVLALLVCGARKEALVLLLAIAVEQAVKIAVKFIVARPRPTADQVNVVIHAHEEFSFPSGHTVHYIVFFGFLWYLVHLRVRVRWVRWPLLAVLGALIVLVGWSRVYLGAHWPTDILGGYLLGAAVLTGAVCVYRAWTEGNAV